jgi:hypothetical protein
VAKANDCVLVTRDQHFMALVDYIVVLKPEEVVFD